MSRIDVRKAAKYIDSLTTAEAGMLAASKGTSLYPVKSTTGWHSRWEFRSRKRGTITATWFPAAGDVRTPAGVELGHANNPHAALHLAVVEERRHRIEVRA